MTEDAQYFISAFYFTKKVIIISWMQWISKLLNLFRHLFPFVISHYYGYGCLFSCVPCVYNKQYQINTICIHIRLTLENILCTSLQSFSKLNGICFLNFIQFQELNERTIWKPSIHKTPLLCTLTFQECILFLNKWTK